MQNTSTQQRANTGNTEIRLKQKKKPAKKKSPAIQNMILPKEKIKNANLSSMTAGLVKQQANLFSSYRRAIIAPEFVRSAKIPTLFPLPTNSIHQKLTLPFQTNSTGMAAIVINPWFLCDSTNPLSYILINNDILLDLKGTGSNKFVAQSMDSKASYDDVSAYRLVSASLHIYPEQSSLTAQGYIAGGIVTRAGELDFYEVGPTKLDIFGGASAKASIIDQSAYYQKSQIGNQAGIRAIYFPFDPTFEMFTMINNGRLGGVFTKDQFYWNYYVSGTTANANMVLEIYYNFEIEPKQESLLQLLTSSIITTEKTQNTLEFVATNPELVTQSSSNLLGLAGEVDSSILSANKKKPLSFLDRTIDFMSNHAGDVLNVLSGIAKILP